MSDINSSDGCYKYNCHCVFKVEKLLLEYSDSYTCNIHHHCICRSQVTVFQTLLALNYNSFILTVAIIGVGIYSTEAGGYDVFDSHARDICIITVIVKGHVYRWK